MSQKKVIWVNYNQSGSVSWHESKFVADICAHSDRIGCIRVDLEARFDRDVIPQEPGALVGKWIRVLGMDATKKVLVLADRRCHTGLDPTQHPLICSRLDGVLIVSSLIEVEEVLV